MHSTHRTNQSVSNGRSALALIGFLALTFTAPALSTLFPGPGAWYASLNKPSWNPPSWLFGPAWTLLYTSMSVAMWLVWKRIGLGRAFGFYLAQLALNAAWTPLFFGAKAMGGAAIEITVLWIAILLTILEFRSIHKLAAFLLIPYLAWVSFATILNITLWRLNSP